MTPRRRSANDVELPGEHPTVDELYSALIEARHHRERQQARVSQCEQSVFEALGGPEREELSAKVALEDARRSAAVLGLVIQRLEAQLIAGGRRPPQGSGSQALDHEVDHVVRLLVWSGREHRAQSGRLPHPRPGGLSRN